MANNASISNISVDLTELSVDTSPQLGGNLDLNSNNITGTGNINTTGTITASGTITGSSFSGDGSSLSGINTDLVSDTTPQLGGNLDLNGNNITGTGNIPAANLTGTLPALDGSNLTGVQAASVDVDESIDNNATYNVLFSDTTGSGNVQMTPIQDDGGLTFNPGTNMLSVNKLYLSQAGYLQFEGSSSNNYETTLSVTNPTADRQITFPNQSGAVRVGYQPGEIIEQLETQADGVAVTVQSGTYTPTNVTATQNLTTTHTVINGSSIDYTPPTGTTRVIYEFWVFMRDTDIGPILHYAGRVAGTQVTNSRHTWREAYASADYQTWIYSKMVLRVGVTENLAAGDVGTWTSSKTLDFTAREYSSSYEGRHHSTNHWDGGGTDIIVKPRIRITAIA